MKLIDTADAAGQVLCHDITQIIRGKTKDARFRKGHIVTEEDIPVLLSLGKDHLYVWEKDETKLHENEAAQVLSRICRNQWMAESEIKEGKIELSAECDGLFLVNSEKLKAVNRLGEMMIATRHGRTAVRKGDKLAGMRVIPLVIDKQKMEEAEQVAGEAPILELRPFVKKKAVILTTGNEVYYGRIQDTFTPVVEEKLAVYGTELAGHTVLPDDPDRLTREIHRAVKELGAELVICTGGMSVDPDDKTPLAIRNTGADVISYGAPVLPGAMFLLAYYENAGRRIPVLGLPGCVMYAKRTIFDLVLPMLMADVEINAGQLADYGEGGLCLSCEVCTYPNCGFGK